VRWSVPTRQAPAEVFPFPEPDSPATLPAVLEDVAGRRLEIEHWGDGTHRDALKFWAGAGGYPGAALARDALDLIRPNALSAVDDPFALSAPQSSSFRLDWRRDYIPVELGFSLNEHTSTMTMMGFPLVELLAVVGLQNARPLRLDRLNYRYGVLGTCVPPLLFRSALGCAPLALPSRSFRMHLGWPGQEGQARCITDVIEDSMP
jgi:CRISPR-associated protein Csx14